MGKTGGPLAANLLDVELVEDLDLGAREEELCAEGGGVQPDSRWWPLARGSRGDVGEATRQGYASLKPRKVGQCVTRLLQVWDCATATIIIRRNKSLGVICIKTTNTVITE
jgi:hypothetical protein